VAAPALFESSVILSLRNAKASRSPCLFAELPRRGLLGNSRAREHEVRPNVYSGGGGSFTTHQ
jgi:hypothetical protein